MAVSRHTAFVAMVLSCLTFTAQQDLDVDDILRQVELEGGDINLDDILRRANGFDDVLEDAGTGSRPGGDPALARPRSIDEESDENGPLPSTAQKSAGDGGYDVRQAVDKQGHLSRRSASTRKPVDAADYVPPRMRPEDAPSRVPRAEASYIDDDGTDDEIEERFSDLADAGYVHDAAEDLGASVGAFGLRVDKATLSVLRRWTNFANGVLLTVLGPVMLAVSASQLSVDRMILSVYVT